MAQPFWQLQDQLQTRAYIPLHPRQDGLLHLLQPSAAGFLLCVAVPELFLETFHQKLAQKIHPVGLLYAADCPVHPQRPNLPGLLSQKPVLLHQRQKTVVAVFAGLPPQPAFVCLPLQRRSLPMSVV